MISTGAGFVFGIAIGFAVVNLYGDRVIDRWQVISAEPPGVQQSTERETGTDILSPLPNPEVVMELVEETLPVIVDALDAVKPDAEKVPEPQAEDTKQQTPAADPTPQPPEATPQVPDLEQRWSEYAMNAVDLEPVGSFPWHRCFQRAAAAHDLPLGLLLAVASGESSFDPAARSDKDAVGLMQIRWPDTSFHLGIRREADLYDPCTNVDAGARYLRELLAQFNGNMHLAVAAYNYGPSRISAGTLPEGAQWYSHYIYQHLQQVLGLATTASSELLPRPGADGGRLVLMTFTRVHRARDFADFLAAEVPGLNVQLQTETLGQHAVVLLYSSEDDRLSALQSLDNAGVGFMTSPSTSKFQL